MGTSREEKPPAPLARRTFVSLTALGLPALLGACSDDAGLGTDTAGSDGTDGGATTAGPTGDASSTGDDAASSSPTSTSSTTDAASTTTGDDTGDTDSTTGEPPDTPTPFDPDAIPESTDVFPRTVLAGDMSPTAVTLAIYIADAAAKRVRVWQPAEQEGEVILLLDAQVTPDLDGFAKLRVEGLAPGEWYRYAYFVQDPEDPDVFTARSLIGEVRTALAPGSEEPVVIAFGACVGHGSVLPDYVDPDDIQPFEWAITDMAEDLYFDLFVHLGDQGYMDQVWSGGGSYESYLAAWGAYHGGGFRKLFPKAGMISTWDDHEVVDNGTVDPWTDDPGERAKIDNAMRAYYRVMPIDAEDPDVEPIWRSFRWGDTVELVVLDCRYERQPEPALAFMSDAQMEFLLDRIENSPCRFVCVATSKPYAHVRLLATDYPGGEERWQGHVADRQKIKDLVNERGIKNVVWVTGDIHMCYLGYTDEEDMSTAGRMREVCCTSGNTNPLANFLSPVQFEWFVPTPHMPVLTFDPVLGEVLVQFHAPDGSISHEQVLTLG